MRKVLTADILRARMRGEPVTWPLDIEMPRPMNRAIWFGLPALGIVAAAVVLGG